MPMPQYITNEKEQCFWLGQDLEYREVLEYGVSPPDIWLEDVGQRVRWGPEPILSQEGLHLSPLTEVPIVEENGAVLAQEDGSAAENYSKVEQAT